jgi:hypothetical protein
LYMRGTNPTEPVTISVLFSGSCEIKGERGKSVREQRNGRTILSHMLLII